MTMTEAMNRAVYLRNLAEEAAKDHEGVEERSLRRQEMSARYQISKSASEFLKSNGFKANGMRG